MTTTNLDPHMAALAARTAAAFRAESAPASYTIQIDEETGDDETWDGLHDYAASHTPPACLAVYVIGTECWPDATTVGAEDAALAATWLAAASEALGWDERTTPILVIPLDGAPDPLLGFSPDEIVVGAGCQTLADASAAEPVTAATAYQLIDHLRSTRPELVHFAGAAHRDPMALEVCREYQRDPEASEDDLRTRARATVYGGDR